MRGSFGNWNIIFFPGQVSLDVGSLDGPSTAHHLPDEDPGDE